MISFYFHIFVFYLHRTLCLLLLLTFLALIFLLSSIAVFTSLKWLINEPNLKHLAIALFYSGFVSVLLINILRLNKLSDFKKEDLRVRIVPYFERAVSVESAGREHPFFYGRQTAKNLRRLDRYARKVGVRPLSHFGFRDDLLGQRMKWYDPNQGLQTIDTILNALTEQGRLQSPNKRHSTLIRELTLIRKWLLMASATNVRFALVARMEHETRLGWSRNRIGCFT